MEGATVPQESAEEFLARRGLESLATRMVTGHDGQPIMLIEALGQYPCVGRDLDNTIALIRDVGGEQADILPHMGRYVDRMGDAARRDHQAPVPAGAGEK